MAEQRTVFHRIRDKVASRLTHRRAKQPAPNSLPVFDIMGPSTPKTPCPPTADRLDQASSCPHPSIVGENVNVVGRDQINVTNNFMSPDPSAEHHLLFKNLSHVVKASFDASTPALRRACTENTRAAILEAIEEWAFDSTKPMVYWMNGMAGTGKTTISYSVSLLLKRHGILGATFFCSRLVDECTKVDRIFPTIAYNLSRNYPPLTSAILEALVNDPDVANRTINQQFTELLVKPIGMASKELPERPIIVVIDALDECANQAEVQTFLSVIFQRSSELPFKMFITSRPEQLVRVGFNRQNPDTYSRLILHDIERDLVNADIKLYMIERLIEIADGRSDFQESTDDWPPEDKIDVLSCQASGLFIFAKTVCDYIGEQGGNIAENLNTAVVSGNNSGQPSGDTVNTSELDRLYRDILDRAIPNRQKERDKLRLILAAIVIIRNPLSARGLGTLLKLEPGVIKSSLGSLHSVISVPKSLDDPVSTFHASLPDCIGDPTRSQHHFLSPSKSHQQLATSCISLMNSSLNENICGLQGRPPNDDIAKDVIGTHISEGLAYACEYWALHLTTARKEEIRDTDGMRELLDEFLREHVLHWMECLSLLKRLNVAITSLRVIEGWVLDIYPEFFNMITDARRFILENFELICDYSLETYHSALVWLPLQSIIRKRYTTQKLDLPKVLVGLRNTWGSCEKVILCGSPVRSVAFSSNGSHIVSGSSDVTVRVWNAVTGEPESILQGHSARVSSVAFSNDGIHIVSGSADADIRIWNVVTGLSERVLEGHSLQVSSVAYSNNGGQIVSGSDEPTILIWNAMTGELERTLEGHLGWVSSVAFSLDGSRIVSGSSDLTVRSWNALTGKSEGIFQGHSGHVLSVAFSSDGSHVASGSADTTVRIWNAVTCKAEDVLEGHFNSVLSVAFSSDGSHIVSGSLDSTVRIWNAATGESEGVLEGHSGPVFSVAFSSDGSHVLSGSEDATIRIWNAVSKESEGVPEGHSSSVLSLAFSSDGSRVVSGSSDTTLRIWDVMTGESERTLGGHGYKGWVRSVAISSDGSHIVSGSDDATVWIWNTLTGESEGVFKGHSDWVSSVAFSGDGSRIVSGSRDGAVRIWDVVTCKPEGVFKGHSYCVASVAFSNDGRYIVSGSDDGIVRIWNAVTGEAEGVFKGHSSSVSSVAFSSDGSHVVSGTGGSIWVWNVATRASKCYLFAQLSNHTEIQYLPSSLTNISIAAYDHLLRLRVFSFLSDDLAWIETDSVQRQCWVPHRYRRFRCIRSYGLKTCLGFTSGEVVVLDVSGT